MQTLHLSSGTRLVACLGVSAITLFACTASAQVNSWIRAGSGNWDDALSWSLGTLPASPQSVVITNSVWKAVAINPSTPINFPGCMTVNSLKVQGAWDTRNVLLLNSYGTALSLTVLNGVTLQDDGRILNFDSGLVVQGGTVVVTNSQISQNGGLVRTTNAQMNLSNAGYYMTNGLFEGGVVWVGAPVASQFIQYGGAATIATLNLGPRYPGSGSRSGTYILYGGYLSLPGGLSVLCDNGSIASYVQWGGSNQTTRVLIEPGFYGVTPFFQLNGGLLAATNVDVFGDDFGSAALEQNGGTLVASNSVHVAGGAHNPGQALPGRYRLNGGVLSTPFLNLDATWGDAGLIQSNGTVQALEIQAHSNGSMTYWVSGVSLFGGTLSCSNLTATDGGGIQQGGGVMVVSNTFSVTGYREPGPRIYTKFLFLGGSLGASNINLGGDMVIGDSALANRISNPGSFSLSHTLQISNAVEQLGQFKLVANAVLDLAGSASRLSFASSSGEVWLGTAILVVSNWNGNASGGGAEQLKFGSNASGLNAVQLAQIFFRDGTGSYPAKILNTGEVVPDRPTQPSLAYTRQGNNLILTWTSGAWLQMATNVTGTYGDVYGATSPYTNNMSLAERKFFRLRQ